MQNVVSEPWISDVNYQGRNRVQVKTKHKYTVSAILFKFKEQGGDIQGWLVYYSGVIKSSTAAIFCLLASMQDIAINGTK